MAPLDARADFLAKRDIALRLMASKSIRWHATPPIYHLYWSCGLRIRPPLFASFLFNFIYMALVGAVGFGFGAFVLDFWGRLDGISRPIIIAAVVVGAMLFGLMSALELRYFARKQNLPPWSELVDEARVFD
jgi:hypothetical protein